MSWQFTFLPIFLIVFWLLLLLKNLSSFRKEFQNMDRKERGSEYGKLFIKALQKKYIRRSVIAFIVFTGLYAAIYLIYKS